MKKSIKLISVLMIAVMMIMVATPVFAADDEKAPATTIDGIIDGVKGSATEATGTGDLNDKVKNIISFLQWVGIIAGVLILTIFGIKYMLGSLEEKAEYKKTMVPFVVGAIVVMAAPSIAKLIFNIITK